MLLISLIAVAGDAHCLRVAEVVRTAFSKWNDMVAREHLFNTVDDAVQVKVILVSATFYLTLNCEERSILTAAMTACARALEGSHAQAIQL